MASIIDKRRSLHSELSERQKQNQALELQIGQLQALANIGTTTCMIAHEINNLLTPLCSYAELALANIDDKPLTEKALGKTVKSSRQAIKVAESILAVTNGRPQEKKESFLRPLVEEIFSCLGRDFSKDSITVNVQIPEQLKVLAVEVEIQQVMMNLILNARDAMLGSGGILTIKAGKKDAETVEIEIRDTGRGIKPSDLDKIFEPFFTTKSKDSLSSPFAAGLGLAFCKKIVNSYNGSITVKSKPMEGTAFTITLPVLN